MDEEITDFEGYEYEEFDGMGNVEDEVLLGESTLAKLREQAPDSAPTEEESVKEAVDMAEEISQESESEPGSIGQDEENE
jgi:hypothetical protein